MEKREKNANIAIESLNAFVVSCDCVADPFKYWIKLDPKETTSLTGTTNRTRTTRKKSIFWCKNFVSENKYTKFNNKMAKQNDNNI